MEIKITHTDALLEWCDECASYSKHDLADLRKQKYGENEKKCKNTADRKMVKSLDSEKKTVGPHARS